MQKLKNNRVFLITSLLFLIVNSALCQEKEYDMQLIQNYSFIDSSYNPREVSFSLIDSKNKFIKYNPLSLVFSTSLFVYQKYISQHFSAKCYYQPSCSEFSRLVIKNYGLLKGIIMTADRISRCNRIAATDFSPGQFDERTHKIHEDINSFKSGKK